MTENILIPLPGFHLPKDFPWRIGFVDLINDQVRRLRVSGHFLPPRYFGYYFQAHMPVAVGGSWTVTVDEVPPVTNLPGQLDILTNGLYTITSPAKDVDPDYLLVHDRRDGSCFLWTYECGLRFIEAVEPMRGGWDEESSKPNCNES